MPDRLSPLDASFLYLETPTTPMHVGSVMVFEDAARVDHVRLARHVAARIAFVPRYRQRLRTVPGRLANPVWVDDARFDISYHVRRSALPRPGTRDQLGELVARLQARPLDRSRPLWELTLVEGLAAGRFAVVTKVHQALVDGVHAVDLGQVVLEESSDSHDPPAQLWRPGPEPSLVELVVGAVADSVRRPAQVVETVRSSVDDAGASLAKLVDVVRGLAVSTATRPTPASPLNRDVTPHRRFAMVESDLADYRSVRNTLRTASERSTRTRRRGRRGADPQPDAAPDVAPDVVPDVVPDAAPAPAASVSTSVNDVVLATLAGGLRAWLLARGEPVLPSSVVRALVPLSVRSLAEGTKGSDAGPPSGAAGPEVGTPDAVVSEISWLLVDLPTGEPSPLVRVHQIAYQTRAHREAGRAVRAGALAELAGFAPPTLHSLGVRAASTLSRRLFNLVVTNVPGPQQPLYLTGARMTSSYPAIPLARGQALSVGLTSYDGGVYYGLTGDRDALWDLDVLGQCLTEALAELVEAARVFT